MSAGEPIAADAPRAAPRREFRAARYGLRGELIDVRGRRSVAASEAIETFLEFLRPALESDGEWDEVASTVFETFARGTGADRQRAAFARAGRFVEVVDLILEETSRGT